ncbi:hypothetical protein Pelo_143 [Pelomyxa schiedti]|nr:hypothetical protein Pelo_143 [Pelomyxa schiedti]
MQWACPVCTYENPISYTACDMCGTERIRDPPGASGATTSSDAALSRTQGELAGLMKRVADAAAAARREFEGYNEMLLQLQQKVDGIETTQRETRRAQTTSIQHGHELIDALLRALQDVSNATTNSGHS